MNDATMIVLLVSVTVIFYFPLAPNTRVETFVFILNIQHAPCSNLYAETHLRFFAIPCEFVTATGFMLDGPDSNTGRPRLPLIHTVQNASGAHTASYPNEAQVPFPGLKWSVREADFSTPSSALHIPHLFSWHYYYYLLLLPFLEHRTSVKLRFTSVGR
jgi:hypothetical protein